MNITIPITKRTIITIPHTELVAGGGGGVAAGGGSFELICFFLKLEIDNFFVDIATYTPTRPVFYCFHVIAGVTGEYKIHFS